MEMYLLMIEISPLLVIVKVEVLIQELSGSSIDVKVLEDFLVWEPSKDLFFVNGFASAKVSPLARIGDSRNWQVVKERKESACS